MCRILTIEPRVINLHGSHNRFLDALKGYAILFVLINHATPLYLKQLTLFDLWGGMAVPLFLLIQVFHFYKHGIDRIKPIGWKKLLFKLVSPYIIAEVSIICIRSFTEHISIGVSITQCFNSWGFGPGEYYIWQYFQFLLLLPLLSLLFKQLAIKHICYLSIIISIGLELLASFIHISEHAYKFLFFRYFFLIFLGYLWSLNGVLLNRKTLLLSCISILFICLFDYTNIDLSLLFYDTSWKCFHWICYFYPAFLLIFILHFIYKRSSVFVQKFLELIGRNSWTIFCVQMVVYYFLSPDLFSFISLDSLRGAMYFFLGISLSLMPVMILKKASLRFRKF